jgi:hypothetical protein
MGQNSSKLETRSSKPNETERTPKETKSIVLLGTGEQGKTTIIKQIPILLNIKVDMEKRHYKEYMYRNIYESIKKSIWFYNKHNLEFPNEKLVFIFL